MKEVTFIINAQFAFTGELDDDVQLEVDKRHIAEILEKQTGATAVVVHTAKQITVEGEQNG